MAEKTLISSLIAGSGMKGIIDAINKLDTAINNNASYLFVDNEIPGGSINGSNKVFALDYNPNPNSSLRVYLNGVYQSSGGEDYTLSATTITFINAPVTNSVLRAFYRHK